MKKTLTLYKEKEKFLVKDISPSLLNILKKIQEDNSFDKGSEMTPSFLLTHLKLLEKSTVNYINFLYPLEENVLQIQIIKKKEGTFIIFLESSFLNNEKEVIEKSYLTNYENFLEKDKKVIDILNLKNRDPEIIQLEIIYLLKKIKEELKELKEKHEKQEEKFIEKEIFTLSYIIDKLGIKNIIIVLFCLSTIESLVIEPFLQPIVESAYDQIEKSIFESD